MSLRVIPRLDIKGPNLVKGIHLEGLRVLGTPDSFARLYYEDGADELLYVDAVASLYGRNSLLEIVARTSRDIFIPLTVTGGIRNLDDIQRALTQGADKVGLNSAAVARPELISEAADAFGSSTIVVSIEYGYVDGQPEVLTHSGREVTGLKADDWALRAVELGAGELLLTCVDQEGTGKGFDLPFLKRLSNQTKVPILASGGAGQPDHVTQAFTDAGVDGVCIGSLFHYSYLSKAAHPEPGTEGNTEFIKSGGSARFPPVSLPEVKKILRDSGLEIRLGQKCL